MVIQKKLEHMGIVLPVPAAAVGSYLPAVRTGNLLFVSGQLPWEAGKLAVTGKVGGEVDLSGGQRAARLCAISALAVLQQAVGLDHVARIVRLEVFVNSAGGFTQQAQVANGASDLLAELFGEAGRHARMAVGVAELPLNAAVELAVIAEVA